MIPLFAGCYCSEPKVHPKNWNQIGASCKSAWYIHYRFYDPTIPDQKGLPKPRLCLIKGMNSFRSLVDRRDCTKKLLENELKLLTVEGFNPITRLRMAPLLEEVEYEIDPGTPFIRAFKLAVPRLMVIPRVKKGIETVIRGLDKAATQLRYQEVSISSLSRRQIKNLLEQAGKNSKKWSNARFNTYRGYLMMLYKELVELEAAPANPMWDISKRQVMIKMKPVLTIAEREKVNEHLAEIFPAFHKFIHLFFHSGGRKPELLQLKPGMIDMEKQTYRCVIKKRKNFVEVERTIKSVALPYWKFFLENCHADQYLFGTRFRPGKVPMGEDMPTKYWKLFVKKDLNIEKDFYSLKHLNTSEVVDQLDEQAAAALNGHTSTAMVVKIYDVRQKDRQHNRLKEVDNLFS